LLLDSDRYTGCTGGGGTWPSRNPTLYGLRRDHLRVLGTALTESQLKLLWRAGSEPVICLDGDSAGNRAAAAAAERALPLLEPGKTLRFVFLAEGADPPLIIAFQILPLVIVFSALAAVLWHWGVLRAAVNALSFLLRRTLGVSGVVGLSGGANLFLGVVESPLAVRAYFARVSRAPRPHGRS